MKFSYLLLSLYFCFAASANELEKTKDYLTRDPDDGNRWVLLGQTQISENKLFAEYSFADCLNRGERTEKAGVIRSGSSLPFYQKQSREKCHLSSVIASGFDLNVILVDEDVMSEPSVGGRGSFFLSPAVQPRFGGRAFGDSFNSISQSKSFSTL